MRTAVIANCADEDQRSKWRVTGWKSSTRRLLAPESRTPQSPTGG